MASCNSWQYLVTILAKIFPRSWQDLAKILLRYPWRIDPGTYLHREGFEEAEGTGGLLGLADEDADSVVHEAGREVHHRLPLVVPDHARHRHVR